MVSVGDKVRKSYRCYQHSQDDSSERGKEESHNDGVPVGMRQNVKLSQILGATIRCVVTFHRFLLECVGFVATPRLE